MSATGHHHSRTQVRFFTSAEVAEHLSVPARTVWRWIKAGALPVHRFGAAVRISEVDLRVFIATRREG